MMKKFGRKALALSLTAVLGASMVLTGCGGKSRTKERKVKTQQQRLVLQLVWLQTQQQIFLL